ncbi:MAG: hypothetical protein VKO01_11745 [Cyanobacteriota bacterium]|jgi:hypothetical protein|nr:hypothetical protein [Cyanobacteriota bacterium]
MEAGFDHFPWRSQQEVKPMLSLVLSYHDILYLLTELGLLGLVLILCWVLPKPSHPKRPA